jgi:hypothetical protein
VSDDEPEEAVEAPEARGVMRRPAFDKPSLQSFPIENS